MREDNNSTQVDPTIITGVSVVEVVDTEREYDFFAPTENNLPEDVRMAVYGETEPQVEEGSDAGTEEVEEGPSSTYSDLAVAAGMSATTGIGGLVLLTGTYFAWYFDIGFWETSFLFVFGAVLTLVSVAAGKEAILDDYLDIEGTMTKWQRSVVASAILIPILGIFCFSAPLFEKQISTWHKNYENRIKSESEYGTFEKRMLIQRWNDISSIDYEPIKPQSAKSIPTRPRRIEVKPIEPVGKSNTLR